MRFLLVMIVSQRTRSSPCGAGRTVRSTSPKHGPETRSRPRSNGPGATPSTSGALVAVSMLIVGTEAPTDEPLWYQPVRKASNLRLYRWETARFRQRFGSLRVCHSCLTHQTFLKPGLHGFVVTPRGSIWHRLVHRRPGGLSKIRLRGTSADHGVPGDGVVPANIYNLKRYAGNL